MRSLTKRLKQLPYANRNGRTSVGARKRYENRLRVEWLEERSLLPAVANVPLWRASTPRLGFGQGRDQALAQQYQSSVARHTILQISLWDSAVILNGTKRNSMDSDQCPKQLYPRASIQENSGRSFIEHIKRASCRCMARIVPTSSTAFNSPHDETHRSAWGTHSRLLDIGTTLGPSLHNPFTH